MARVSITKAAKLAGISRSHLYKSYIDTNLISLSKNEKNKPYIDTSELLRVFGTLTEDTSKTGHNTAGEDNVEHSQKAVEPDPSILELELKLVKEQLEESRTREDWYKKQIDSLTDTMKLLEGPKQLNRTWWKFW